MTYDVHSLEGYSTVAAVSGTTPNLSITVQTGDGAKFGIPQNATIWPAGVQALRANSTIGRISAIAGDVLTVTTNQEGSAARTVVVGDQIANTITPKVLTDIEAGPVSSRSYVYNNFASPMTVAANTYGNFLQIVDFIDTDGTPLFSYDTTNHRYNVLQTCMVQMYGDLFWNDVSAEPTINMYLRWHGPTFAKSWVDFVRGFDYDILPKYGWRFQTPLLRFDAGDTFTLEIYKSGTAALTVNYAEVWGVAFAVS